ncbi:ribosomal protein L13 [Hamiltosporidium tvaerminnensis]|uniref:Ribosomal protein L13 n=2 Tax=Hamiltosporidium TaxID=1176354 RepID=A0A4Q9LRV9_9MICR|nr:negative regulation of formation of translation preinitiation complex [Hamiltosporidium tvaerminnensis]TBU07253.1 ribosomal protein L13 [Hamiltosporidium magnivora]TBU10411.1 ribosomal protein L13 [Hamiltosporidium tvaerminnensis]TBU13613.1 ribosomal protein L13 [Hamiltosporidium tvaerminnensis]
MISKEIVVDGKDHIAGKLGSFIAKHLLEGYTIKVVNADLVVFNRSLKKAVEWYKDYLRKKSRINPLRGPFHYHEPSKLFFRVVKRMVQYQIKKGKNALSRLTIFEGIPQDLIDTEFMMCPKAMRGVGRTFPDKKFCSFGQLCSRIGWKHGKLLDEIRKEQESIIQRKKSEMEAKQKEINEIRSSVAFQREVNDLISKIE